MSYPFCGGLFFKHFYSFKVCLTDLKIVERAPNCSLGMMSLATKVLSLGSRKRFPKGVPNDCLLERADSWYRKRFAVARGGLTWIVKSANFLRYLAKLNWLADF